MIRSPAGFDGGDRIKRYLDYYQPSYGVMMLSAGQFSPASLFSSGEQGAWYDPSDLSTLFQDSAGSTPVTAVEQPVGLIRDKSGRGNHASQSTAASRPVLSARVNQLTYSEQFDNAVWSPVALSFTPNATTAPDGAGTADLVYPTSTGSSRRFTRAAVSSTVAVYTWSISAKYSGIRWLYVYKGDGSAVAAWFDVQNGAVGTVAPGYSASVTAQSSGFYRLTLTTPSGAPTFMGYFGLSSADNSENVTANGTDGIYLWGADLRVTNTGVNLPAYQRVAAATDYDTSGFPLYLRVDGTDDSLATGTINFSSTDKISVFAGIRKLSDAAAGVLAELSADSNANNGTFAVVAPPSINPFYRFRSKGTGMAQYDASGYAAPITNVVTGIGDIAGDIARIRVNGVDAGNDTTDQGTGNYGSYPLYIGRRGGSAVPFNGNIYGLVVRGAASTDAQISAMEKWMASKAGIAI